MDQTGVSGYERPSGCVWYGRVVCVKTNVSVWTGCLCLRAFVCFRSDCRRLITAQITSRVSLSLNFAGSGGEIWEGVADMGFGEGVAEVTVPAMEMGEGVAEERCLLLCWTETDTEGGLSKTDFSVSVSYFGQRIDLLGVCMYIWYLDSRVVSRLGNLGMVTDGVL